MLSYRASVVFYFDVNLELTFSSATKHIMAHDEEYFVPAEDQRVFGAGIKRKRVAFVPAATAESPLLAPWETRSGNAADRYLSIVFPSATRNHNESIRTSALHTKAAGAASPTANVEDSICDICNLPVNSDSDTSLVASKPHESSLVHQLCLAYSHPPSHLDRSRHGLKYLSSYGWDPDSRLGLGANGEGIRDPLKGVMKNNTVGLGVKQGMKKGQVVEQKVVQRLDVKGVRKKDDEDRKRREKLQRMFYGNSDVDRYLGSNE